MSETFRDNVVVITGASKGIGAELARRLAAQGALLALAARDAAALEAVATECRALGGKAIAVIADVGKQDDCRALMARAVAEFGRIDTLVNNAGATMWARFDEVGDLRIFEDIMRVNYLGAVYCTHYALPHLKQARGRLVGISSLTGKVGVPTRSGYAASKHAMNGFFDSLRIELEDSGVTVTMVCPGFVATGIRENASGPDGKPIKVSPVKEGEVMSVEECCRIIMRAMAARRREEVMTLRGKLGQWLKLIAPGAIDAIARKAIERGR